MSVSACPSAGRPVSELIVSLFGLKATASLESLHKFYLASTYVLSKMTQSFKAREQRT